MKDVRILLADDHSLVRAGIRGLLEGLSGVKVIGEAANGQDAIDCIALLKPDILLTDIAMPSLDGLALTELVAKEHPATRVIILSMHSEREYADKALRAGAAGFLIKDSGTAELELAIRAVARGESYLSPAVSKHVVADYARMASNQSVPSDPLSPRQREVLKLIAEGLPTKIIARRLDISVKTAETHRAQLMERLDIHEVAGLVRYAIRIGLVNPDT